MKVTTSNTKQTTTHYQGFTLIELVVVVIIIGILAGIAFPNYTRAREKTIDKEAQAILSLIRSAERTYAMQTGSYYPATGSTVTNYQYINSNLSLDLVPGNWQYEVRGMQGFYAKLSRNQGGYSRYWYINSTQYNASCSGTCP